MCQISRPWGPIVVFFESQPEIPGVKKENSMTTKHRCRGRTRQKPRIVGDQGSTKCKCRKQHSNLESRHSSAFQSKAQAWCDRWSPRMARICRQDGERQPSATKKRCMNMNEYYPGSKSYLLFHPCSPTSFCSLWTTSLKAAGVDELRSAFEWKKARKLCFLVFLGLRQPILPRKLFFFSSSERAPESGGKEMGVVWI